MLTHEEMIGLQAEKHELVKTSEFKSIEEYVLYLIHNAAYDRTASLLKDKRVLDLGCNMGYGTSMLAKSAKEVIGVDVSEKAIAFAKNQYGHPGIDFQQIDGKVLPFDNQTFDAVVSFQVIEHIVDHESFINEIKRILKPGGVVVFTTPNSEIRLYPGMKPWNEFHVREFNHSELKALLDKFFKSANVQGLFASEPLYSIEVERVSKIRERVKLAEKNSSKQKRLSLRAIARSVIPDRVVRLLRRSTEILKVSQKPAIQHIAQTFGVNDFFYQEQSLETALDLLVICGGDEKVVLEMAHELLNNTSEKSKYLAMRSDN